MCWRISTKKQQWPMENLTLYNYFRSSTSYRVRIALELKKIPYTYKAIHLLNNGGEHNQAAYRAINPMGGVPTLIHKDAGTEFSVAQSSAIIEYLDEAFPQTYQLLTKDPKHKAKIREFCQIINADIHAYGNLKTLQYLEKNYAADEEKKNTWVQHWVGQGLKACEILLKNSVHHNPPNQASLAKFCFGDNVTAAECYLVPLIFMAQRFKVNLDSYPVLMRIYAEAIKLDAFKKAHPYCQLDTPEDLRIKN